MEKKELKETLNAISTLKRRKKLTVSKTGKLNYPHLFYIGQMVEYRKDFKRSFSNASNSFDGNGIIVDIDEEKSLIKIFWQISGVYFEMGIPECVLRFKEVS